MGWLVFSKFEHPWMAMSGCLFLTRPFKGNLAGALSTASRMKFYEGQNGTVYRAPYSAPDFLSAKRIRLF